MRQDKDVKEEIEKLIKEAQLKAITLPQSYFIQYILKNFLTELKEIIHQNT